MSMTVSETGEKPATDSQQHHQRRAQRKSTDLFRWRQREPRRRPFSMPSRETLDYAVRCVTPINEVWSAVLSDGRVQYWKKTIVDAECVRHSCFLVCFLSSSFFHAPLIQDDPSSTSRNDIPQNGSNTVAEVGSEHAPGSLPSLPTSHPGGGDHVGGANNDKCEVGMPRTATDVLLQLAGDCEDDDLDMYGDESAHPSDFGTSETVRQDFRVPASAGSSRL